MFAVQTSNSGLQPNVNIFFRVHHSAVVKMDDYFGTNTVIIIHIGVVNMRTHEV